MEALRYFLTNVLVPLVIGGIGAYAYPRIESYLKNRSLSSRQRKINALLSEYAIVKHFGVNQTYLILDGFFSILMGIDYLGLLILVIGVGILFPFEQTILRTLLFIFLGFVAFYAHSLLYKVSRQYMYATDLDGYKESILAKLKQLGGNPEELDKIDKSFERPKQETA